MKEYVHKVCERILEKYMLNPWGWVRESDLVPEVARRLTSAIDGGKLAQVDLKLSKPLARHGKRIWRVPRVRTEVRLSVPQTSHSAESEETPGKQRRQRIDLAVYRNAAGKPVIKVNGNGVRDALLHGKVEEFETLIEVKLTPGKWITSENECRWFNDVEKLERFSEVPTRVVLLVDTALPLKSVGVTYDMTRSKTELYSVPRGDLAVPWPLRSEAFAFNARGRRWTFTPCTPRSKPGLYLWAIGLKGRAPWNPEATRIAPVKAIHVKPTCWKVTVK